MNGTLPFEKKEFATAHESAAACFISCAPRRSLLKPNTEAAKDAAHEVAFLISPACFSFEPTRNDQQTGKILCPSVKTTGMGMPAGNPNIRGRNCARLKADRRSLKNLFRGFLRENAGTKKMN